MVVMEAFIGIVTSACGLLLLTEWIAIPAAIIFNLPWVYDLAKTLFGDYKIIRKTGIRPAIGG
jgi:hypothetical protein